jgi:hypothetical protein
MNVRNPAVNRTKNINPRPIQSNLYLAEIANKILFQMTLFKKCKKR